MQKSDECQMVFEKEKHIQFLANPRFREIFHPAKSGLELKQNTIKVKSRKTVMTKWNGYLSLGTSHQPLNGKGTKGNKYHNKQSKNYKARIMKKNYVTIKRKEHASRLREQKSDQKGKRR
jgi:hypothetical protein